MDENQYGESTQNGEGSNTYTYESEQGGTTENNQYGSQANEKYGYGDGLHYEYIDVKKPIGIMPICLISGVIMWLGDFILGFVLLFLFGQWMHYWHSAYSNNSPSQNYYIHQMKSYRLAFWIVLGVVIVLNILFFILGAVALVSLSLW